LEKDNNDSLAVALTLVRRAVWPERLNTIQESVFSQCWKGESYQEIADSLDYDAIYIRSIGAQLWKQLSKVFGEKVAKSNFQAIIKHHLAENRFAENRLAEQNAFSPSITSVAPVGTPPLQVLETCLTITAADGTSQEDYYIERPPIEKRCYEAIVQQGALLRIKAPKQMGKTSLMTKVLLCVKKHQHHTVVVNLRLADGHILSDLDRFLQWFCAVICDQLNIAVDLEQHWKPIFGSNYNCTQFFSRILLPQLGKPVVIALDDVDVLFDHPMIATDFLGLVRAWCEKAKQSNKSDAWHLLKLLVIHSTEVYIPLHHHQSPFNVGLSIELPYFTAEQVMELANRYAVIWTDDEVASLMALVGGKPDLVRFTLDWVVGRSVSLFEVIENATTPKGIDYEHLRQQFRLIQKYPKLIPLFQQVVTSEQAVALPALQGFQLESLGMVKLQGQDATPSCALYRQYFGSLLGRL